MEQRWTEVGDFRIHSRHAGSTGAPGVVLLHGLSGSHRWWLKTIPALAERYRVHVPELVGFGASRRPPRQPDIPEMAGVILGWLDALELERPHLVGHSMGGQVSIHLAAGHPERVDRLVLVSASGIPRARTLRELRRFMSELALPRTWVRPRFASTIVLDALRAGPRALARATASILGDDVRPLLPRIRSRTLLVWGALDPLTPPAQGEEMARGIPGARLRVFPAAAHIPMVEWPEVFNHTLLSFLAAP